MLEKVNLIMKKNNFPGYINILTLQKVYIPYEGEKEEYIEEI